MSDTFAPGAHEAAAGACAEMSSSPSPSAAIPAVFAFASAQPQATQLLLAALAQDRVSHAYLFVGPSGALIKETARAFAASLACADGGCGTCATCTRILRGAHQDVIEVAPLGARAYLVEQIREVVAAAQYKAVASPKKVFIIDRADLMNQASANAFLKTLEEPAEDVVFILIAPQESSVLPTILSRCQPVRFRAIPSAEGVALVCARTGLPASRAALALAATEGSITDAVAFAQDADAWELRTRVFAALNTLHEHDSYRTLCAAKSFGDAWLAPAEALKQEQKELRERNKEFFDAQGLKAADARDKRAVTAATAAGFGRITGLIRSWLSDVLLAREGMTDRIANTDFAAEISHVAGLVDECGIRESQDACARAEQYIAYNVQPQNALDALMLELRSALYH